MIAKIVDLHSSRTISRYSCDISHSNNLNIFWLIPILIQEIFTYGLALVLATANLFTVISVCPLAHSVLDVFTPVIQ